MNEQENLQYEIIYSNIKNVYIQIKEGKVIIKAPKIIPKKDLNRIIEQKTDWIQKSLEKEKKKNRKKTTVYTRTIQTNSRKKCK